MNILVINNHTEHLDSLQKALAGHRLEVQKYRPGLDFHWQDKDLVILSGGGGQGLEIHDLDSKGKLWYDDEMRFISGCQLPMLGICMGFEVICRLYGSDVTPIGRLVEGFEEFRTSRPGWNFLSKPRLSQFEAHRWRVPGVDPAEFEVLATSGTGVEMIRHKSRRLVATQFHPEVEGGTLSLSQLLTGLAAVSTP